MKEVIIAFDVDGVLRDTTNISAVPYFEAVCLIVVLSHMKNTKIYAWSGGGKEYAESMVRQFKLENYVDECFSKVGYDADRYGNVDICFDDVAECQLADKNIIV